MLREITFGGFAGGSTIFSLLVWAAGGKNRVPFSARLHLCFPVSKTSEGSKGKVPQKGFQETVSSQNALNKISSEGFKSSFQVQSKLGLLMGLLRLIMKVWPSSSIWTVPPNTSHPIRFDKAGQSCAEDRSGLPQQCMRSHAKRVIWHLLQDQLLFRPIMIWYCFDSRMHWNLSIVSSSWLSLPGGWWLLKWKVLDRGAQGDHTHADAYWTFKTLQCFIWITARFRIGESRRVQYSWQLCL